jgi:hypothetical protein
MIILPIYPLSIYFLSALYVDIFGVGHSALIIFLVF